MRSLFVDIERELRWLNEKLASSSAELLIIYGIRRVGKSTLVLRAIERLPRAIYFQHTLKSITLQLRELQEIAGSAILKHRGASPLSIKQDGKISSSYWTSSPILYPPHLR